MDDGEAARRSPDGRPRRPQSTATAVAATAAGPDRRPPDVIDVVFPVPSPGDADRPERRRGDRPGRLRDRPLLLGAACIAAVGIAAVIAWQVWPQSPDSTAPELLRPAPVSTSARAPLPGGISGRAADALPTGTARAPDALAGGPTRTPGATGTPGAPGAAPTAGAPSSPLSPPAGTTAPADPSASPSPSAPGTAAPGPRTLRAGDSGPDVIELQQLLFAQGFTYVSPTGTYDEETVRGVTQVQRDRGLSCDPAGVYGPCTRRALTS